MLSYIMVPVMKIGIFYNIKQVERAIAESLAARIEAAGSSAVVFSREEEILNVDRLVVLGGDGTVLRAARRASECKVPLFGINYGHLGFLTEFERDEMDDAVSFLFAQSCERVERAMLEVEFKGTATSCLNECALLRSIRSGEDMDLVRFAVSIDGNRAGDLTADGLIIATPTGSTAYSLSSGGSIITPDCDAFIFTPVCSVSMRSRPIVYSSQSVLTFTLLEGRLMLFGDGRSLGEIGAGDSLSVRKSSRSTVFLTRDRTGFFKRITEKIN